MLPNLASEAHKRSKENSFSSSVGSHESSPKYLDSLDPGYDAIKPIKDKGSTGSNESSRNEEVDNDPLYSIVGGHDKTII